MKVLLTTLFALATSTTAMADDFSIQGAEGKVFYKIKGEGIVKRASSLSKNEDGHIQLTSGEKTITSVYSKKESDGAGFKVVIVFPGKKKDDSKPLLGYDFSEVYPEGGYSSYVVFKGRKLYSADKKLFWGNFYKVFPKRSHGSDEGEAKPTTLNASQVAETVMKGGKHHNFKKVFFGGFMFKK